jgi:flagellar assembly protein FliH
MSSWTDALPDLGGTEGGRGGFDPEQVEASVRAGYEAGFAAGRADGHAAAFAAAQEEVVAAHELDRRQAGAVLLSLRDELHRLTLVEAAVRAEFEAAVVDAALALAEAVVGRELATATDPGRDAILRALAVAPAGPEAVVVRLHPTDRGRLGDLAALALGREVTVVADPSLLPGGCVATFGTTEVDATVDAALDRARAALRGEA